MNFQRSVLLIGVIILIISIIIMTFSIISFNNRKQIWAPSISMCPDYWNIIKNKENGLLICMPGEHNSGDASGTLGFNVNKYPSNRDKALFAHKYNIVWDGISNNPKLLDNEESSKSIFSLFGWN